MAVTTKPYRHGDIIYYPRLKPISYSPLYFTKEDWVPLSPVEWNSGVVIKELVKKVADDYRKNSMNIKVGGVYEVRPEFRSVCGNFNDAQGVRIRVDNISGGGELSYTVIDYQGNHRATCNCLREEHLIVPVATKNNNPMNIKDSFALAFKAEPEKSFRKAGITNGDDFLTTDGQHIFLSWLLKKHGEEFKKDVVDGLLEDMKEKKNA